MANIRTLGVHATTGQPISGDQMLPSEMNVVEAFGRFPRIFDNVIELNGEIDRDYVIGTAQQGKLSWYVLDDAIRKAQPYSILFKLKSFKGIGAIQAATTLNDGATSPLPTLILKDSYRDNDSYGVWGNSSGSRVDHGVISSTSIGSNPLNSTAATTIPLSSVVNVKRGSILKITHSNNVYGFKILSIDENAKTVTGIPDSTLPILTTGDKVEVLGFKITAVRKDYRGLIIKQQIGFNDRWLSMEPESEDYAPVIFKTHPLFKAVDQSSTAQFWKKFPVPTPDGQYLFLSNGSDGSAPASVSDWTGLQSYFPQKNTFAVLNCESTSKTVHQSFETWCANRNDHPIYLGPIQDFGSDWQSLRDWGQDFIKREGWVQTLLTYGWRYVPDPVGDGSDPVALIPVIGGVLGNWIKVIYSGCIHRAPAEKRFTMSGYVSGPIVRQEDSWDDTIRTELYVSGINIVNNVSGYGIVLRNFRTPAEDALVRDGHIHAINQLIKFTCEQNLQKTENTPNQFKLLQRDALRIEHEVLKPLYEGNYSPYCVDEETGAFRNTDENGNPLKWNDVVGARADRFNNPPTQFDQGDADIWVEWVPYSLRRSLNIKAYTAVKIFRNRG
ncbi:hypothetical protein [Leptospira interrogans]|uniref:hypothetical protein n=1 Tax=Leptospira interrogans TaxID=173 RepID=UPI000346B864|nr:hypothetical protein [Leptospira interrogans]